MVALALAAAGAALAAVGLWPVPGIRTTIELDEITSVEAIDVRPLSHGGWGYRGRLRLLGKAAVVLRSGDGIRLELSGGREIVLSIDDAVTGAGVLGDLLRGTRPDSTGSQLA